MADVYGGPFANDGAGYTDVSTVCVAAAQDEIGVHLVAFAALLGVTLVVAPATAGTYSLVEGVDSPHPDFDAIRPEQRDKIGKELTAIWDAVDAAPVV